VSYYRADITKHRLPLRDRRLSRRLNRIISSAGILDGVMSLVKDVSELPIEPIFRETDM
jgi:hypothetical protein